MKRFLQFGLLLAAVFLSVAPAGCASARPEPLDGRPGAWGDRAGLDVLLWVVDDEPGLFARVLGPYLDRPLPMSSRDREVWASNGLRVITVPAERTGEIRQQLAPRGGIEQRERIGQQIDWLPLAAGPALRPRMPVNLDLGRSELDGGRLRLLARTWPEPMPAASAAGVPLGLRIDLVPEHHIDADRTWHAEVSAGIVPEEMVRAQGGPFERLMAELMVTTDDAILIVGESPLIEWHDRARAAGTTARTGDPVSSSLVRWPYHLDAPTLGELLLRSGGGPGEPSARIVVVILPRVPGRLTP